MQFSNASYGLLGDLRLGWGSTGLSLRLHFNTGGTGSIHGLETQIPFVVAKKIQKTKEKRQLQRLRAAKNKTNTAVEKNRLEFL